MPSIHLQLPDRLDAKARELARKLNLNRSAYIRRAVEKFNVQVDIARGWLYLAGSGRCS